jgi:hypothetical protein
MVRFHKVVCKQRWADRKSLIAKIRAEMPCIRRLLMVNFSKLSSFNMVSWSSQRVWYCSSRYSCSGPEKAWIKRGQFSGFKRKLRSK